MRNIAPQQALQVNAEIPVAQGPNPAAVPFKFKGRQASRGQALDMPCQRGLLRSREPGRRRRARGRAGRPEPGPPPGLPGDSVCGVVYQGSTRATGCQFTFTCDGSLYRQPDAVGWRRASRVAEAALGGSVYAPVGWATHYHADYVVPYWASSLAKNAMVGAHIFYHWAGEWGQPAIFTKSYAGREPNALGLRNAALARRKPRPAAKARASPTRSTRFPARKRSSSPRRCVATSGSRCASTWSRRKASDEATHEDYAKKFEASDNLKYALSSETTAADEKPLGKAADARAAPGSGSAARAPLARSPAQHAARARIRRAA